MAAMIAEAERLRLGAVGQAAKAVTALRSSSGTPTPLVSH
jgi:hypothetical protein